MGKSTTRYLVGGLKKSAVRLDSMNMMHTNPDLISQRHCGIGIARVGIRQRFTGGCSTPSFSPPVAVFDPLASLTASEVTTLLEPDELELDFFTTSLELDESLDEEELDAEEEEAAFAASRPFNARSLCLSSSASVALVDELLPLLDGDESADDRDPDDDVEEEEAEIVGFGPSGCLFSS